MLCNALSGITNVGGLVNERDKPLESFIKHACSPDTSTKSSLTVTHHCQAESCWGAAAPYWYILATLALDTTGAMYTIHTKMLTWHLFRASAYSSISLKMLNVERPLRKLNWQLLYNSDRQQKC